MPQKPFEFLRLSWPVGFVAVPVGVGYSLLLCFFGDAIEAAEELDEFLFFSQWGGPETLFFLNSILLGWISIVVLEHRLGIAGSVLWAISLACWVGAIGGGFALGAFLSESIRWGATLDLIVLCTVSVACAGGFRIYLSDLL